MKKQFLLKVPYYSQQLDVEDKFWKPRSCGIVSLAMAMEFISKQYSLFAHSRPPSGELRGFCHFAPLCGDHAKMTSKSLPRRQAGAQKLIASFFDQLISEGLAIGARDPAHGWIHEGLVKLAKRHGFKKSFRKEWNNKNEKTKAKALSYMIVLLRRGIPILVSMRARSGGHLVLLVGFKTNEGFYYHDPDFKSRKQGAYKYMSFERFVKIWKKRIIVIK